MPRNKKKRRKSKTGRKKSVSFQDAVVIDEPPPKEKERCHKCLKCTSDIRCVGLCRCLSFPRMKTDGKKMCLSGKMFFCGRACYATFKPNKKTWLGYIW